MKLRICDDQKQVSVPGFLNDEMSLLQRYVRLKLRQVTFDPCCVSKGEKTKRV